MKQGVNCELRQPCSFPAAATALQDAAQHMDNAAEGSPVQAVAKELKDIAYKIDTVADQKISHVQNRLSFSVFREAVGDMFQQLPPLNVRQRVMAVYHMGANFFLREERSQGQGVQGTIQSWPDQYFDETPELRDAVEAEGGLVSCVALLSPALGTHYIRSTPCSFLVCACTCTGVACNCTVNYS